MRFATRLQRFSSACLEAVDRLAFPMVCLVCEAEDSVGPFCRACRDELVAASDGACPRCALARGPWSRSGAAAGPPGGNSPRGLRSSGCSRCRKRSLGFDAALALGPYQGPVRDACLRMKRTSGAWLAPWLVELIVEAHGAALQREVESAGAGACVVPVPLHWRRRWVRGYNQANALACALARRLEIRLRKPLQRIRATSALFELDRKARAEELRHAFRGRSRVEPYLADRTILLVDDILTTGATCGAAARVLKRAGAARVVAVVVGRAEGTG